MSNQPQSRLVGVVVSWYLRKFKIVRGVSFVCLGLVSLALLIVIGATLEGGSGVAVPLVITLALASSMFLLARYAHRRVTHVDQHDLVAALRENPGDVEIVKRSTTIVLDLTVAGLLAGRKQIMPCLKLHVRRSGKHYLVPMTDDECDGFTTWLAGAKPQAARAA